VEFTCSLVTIAEMLLREKLALVGRNIPYLIRVSSKKEGNVCMCASGSLRVLSFPHVFASAPPILG
jgi:hypothetical protein